MRKSQSIQSNDGTTDFFIRRGIRAGSIDVRPQASNVPEEATKTASRTGRTTGISATVTFNATATRYWRKLLISHHKHVLMRGRVITHQACPLPRSTTEGCRICEGYEVFGPQKKNVGNSQGSSPNRP